MPCASALFVGDQRGYCTSPAYNHTDIPRATDAAIRNAPGPVVHSLSAVEYWLTA